MKFINNFHVLEADYTKKQEVDGDGKN